jgi:hypothetical protein
VSTHKTSDMESSLLAKGFVRVDTHHEMYWLHVGGRKTSIRTRISHGMREYSDNLLSQMAKQLKLKRKELDELIECPLSAEAYRHLLVAGGHIALETASES